MAKGKHRGPSSPGRARTIREVCRGCDGQGTTELPAGLTYNGAARLCEYCEGHGFRSVYLDEAAARHWERCYRKPAPEKDRTLPLLAEDHGPRRRRASLAESVGEGGRSLVMGCADGVPEANGVAVEAAPRQAIARVGGRASAGLSIVDVSRLVDNGGLQGRCMCAVMACYGLRASEVGTLAWVDVNPIERLITIHRVKGGPVQTFDLPANLARLLVAWSALARGQVGGDQFVFPGRVHVAGTVRRIEGLGRAAVWQVCKAHAAAIGVQIPAGVKSPFRAWLADTLQRRGVPLDTIRAVLGHASIASTAHYLREGERFGSASVLAVWDRLPCALADDSGGFKTGAEVSGPAREVLG